MTMEANEFSELLQALEGRLGEKLNEVETSLREKLSEAETRLREYIDERTHDAETRIVRAFGAYQQSATARFARLKPISPT